MPGDVRDASVSSPDSSFQRSLKKSRQFNQVFRNGRRFRGRAFRAVYTLNTLGVVRLGFSLSAKSGGSVQRNRFRRRIRNLARETAAAAGADVVILPEGKVGDKSWQTIREDYLRFAEELEKSAGRES